MSYLKKPKIAGRLNVRIQIKDDQGSTSEFLMENCEQDIVDKLLGIGVDITSYSVKPEIVSEDIQQ